MAAGLPTWWEAPDSDKADLEDYGKSVSDEAPRLQTLVIVLWKCPDNKHRHSSVYSICEGFFTEITKEKHQKLAITALNNKGRKKKTSGTNAFDDLLQMVISSCPTKPSPDSISRKKRHIEGYIDYWLSADPVTMIVTQEAVSPSSELSQLLKYTK
jgi:hypothetical protein